MKQISSSSLDEKVEENNTVYVEIQRKKLAGSRPFFLVMLVVSRRSLYFNIYGNNKEKEENKK